VNKSATECDGAPMDVVKSLKRIDRLFGMGGKCKSPSVAFHCIGPAKSGVSWTISIEYKPGCQELFQGKTLVDVLYQAERWIKRRHKDARKSVRGGLKS